MSPPPDHPYTRLDHGLARFLAARATLAGADVERFAALLRELSAGQAAGHSCLRLAAADQALAQASGLASADGFTPLILEQDRLYLRRYWQYEQQLVARLAELGRPRSAAAADEALLDRYFPQPAGAEVDWQRRAAAAALAQGLTIISGGPGTGKTTTVVKILALLLESAGPLHMALAAPTGKAAMRLQEAIAAHKANLPCPQDIRERIPDQVATIHRLLGPRPPSPYFRHDADNPLPHDVVVIDESSMVDLALMSKLLAAIRPDARLVLLGDRDQLASVESGAVLADITQSLPARTVMLQKSWRFQGRIGELAELVNRQQADAAWRLLAAGRDEDEVFLLAGDPYVYIADRYAEYLQCVANGAEIAEIFSAFDRFRVLCANLRGRRSVADVNQRVERLLAGRGLIEPGEPWYAGRPVMMTGNDPALQLYNGDVGLCLATAGSEDRLQVFFRGADGRLRQFLPARLGGCETVYAMTVHKSQGSEYAEVLVMLPETVNPVLGRELLYTAVTRARQRVGIVADQAVFRVCVERKVERYGGLAGKLRLAAGQ